MKAPYDDADRAVRLMNRENLKTFGRLKSRLAKWDEINLIREVSSAYGEALRMVKRRYIEIARLAYEQALLEAGGKKKKAPIDRDWILDWLEETDPVTMYKFIPEWERKKARLIEALPVAQKPAQEIDKALKAVTRQIGQASIGITDTARLEAFEDAGILRVMWITQHDERVCEDCEPLDGKIFRIDEVPKKHWNCRCYLWPVLD